ncbi:hypothetical protein ACH47Z_40115 [Streptomyces sp. NPDC020192]|uniref:hypothetical protein n=1 Tax=Streptomyces sp. NPDC020192 TaxID=3365066 RepID=UPI0037A9F6D5
MSVFRRLRRPPTLELDDIQATLLRVRPEPCFGTHAILEITEPAAGRQLLRRLAPRVTSAAGWDEPRPPWQALALSYEGLVALGVPQESPASFPANFRAGTAAYETELGKVPGVRLLSHRDFAADGFNVFGYRDGFSRPVVEGSGAEPLPGDGRLNRAGEFVLGYPSETGHPLPAPTPDVLGRNGTYVVFRTYHSHVAAFNKWLHDTARTEAEPELLAAKLVGRRRSGAPLALAPERDNPAIGEDPNRINDFDYAADPRGLRTPLGSHIRRLNPRDTMTSCPSVRGTLWRPTARWAPS